MPLTQIPSILTWLDIVAFVGLAAAFGGLLKGIYSHSIISKQSGFPNFLELVVEALIGVGGGAAVVLASIWLNKFDYNNTEQNKLFLIVLGTVAGFIGYRLLPLVAKGLEERVTSAQE